MTKLNKYTRESMARALVMHKFGELGESLAKEASDLFNSAYDERYPADVQRAMARLIKDHPGAFGKANYFSENARGMWITIGNGRFGHSGCHWSPEHPSRPVFHNDDKEPLSDETLGKIADFALKTKQFSEDVQAAYHKALGTLAQFSTAKRLQEEWPEALPIIGGLIPVENRALPVVQLATINEDFGLPPSEKIAA